MKNVLAEALAARKYSRNSVERDTCGNSSITMLWAASASSTQGSEAPRARIFNAFRGCDRSVRAGMCRFASFLQRKDIEMQAHYVVRVPVTYLAAQYKADGCREIALRCVTLLQGRSARNICVPKISMSRGRQAQRTRRRFTMREAEVKAEHEMLSAEGYSQ